MAEKASEELETEIDFRLAYIWAQVEEDMSVEFVGSLLRAAYGKGYCDALTEPKRGMLCSDFGYAIPKRKK